MIDLTYTCMDKGESIIARPIRMADRAAWGEAYLFMPYSPKGSTLTMADNAFSRILKGQQAAEWDGQKIQPHDEWRYAFAIERAGNVTGFAAFAGNNIHDDGITQTIAMMVPEYKGKGLARILWTLAPVIFGDRLGYQSSTVQVTGDSVLRPATTGLPAIKNDPGELKPGKVNSESQFETYYLPISEFIDGVNAGLEPRAAEWLNGNFVDPNVEAMFPHHIRDQLAIT